MGNTDWPHGIGVEIDRPSQTGSELDWTHTDNLGSVVAITDVDGNLKEALQYDAWGSRRNTSGAPVAIGTPQVTENTDNKGYTFQEQIDSLELVHLNGRVYDPLIGKFLSGDPFVSDPKNGQNYNRYSYVLNNPMNTTDPTGFEAAPAAGTTPPPPPPPPPPAQLCIGCAKNGASVLILPDGTIKIGMWDGDSGGVQGTFTVTGTVTSAQSSSSSQVGATKGIVSGDAIRSSGGRDPKGLGSALLDTGKGVWNGGLDVIEGAPNLFLGGAFRGQSDYNAFLSGLRPSAYDTPLFGDTIEFLTTLGFAGFSGKAGAADSAADIPVVNVSRSKYPESAGHIEDAQAAGQPSTLTIDRDGAAARRKAALGKTPTQPNLDRDEYPPAMFQEGGKGASVRLINPSDNRGAGACIGAQCGNYPNGTQIRLQVTN